MEELINEFERIEKNHGWIPEHKERIKDLIIKSYNVGFEKGWIEAGVSKKDLMVQRLCG